MFKENTKQFFLKFKIEILILISFALACSLVGFSWFNTHMSRDLMRIYYYLDGSFTNWLGPEMGRDFKQLPGPAYYLLLLPFAVVGSVKFILFGKLVLLYGSIYLLIKEIRKQYSENFALNFSFLFLLAPFFIFTSVNFWNPSLIIMFNCLQLCLVLRNKAEPNSVKYVIFSTVVAIIGMQIHFSTMLAYFAFVLAVLLTQYKNKKIRYTQLTGLLVVLTWLSIWYFSANVNQLNTQISETYGLFSLKHLFNRTVEFLSQLSFFHIPINDYDLFTLMINFSSSMGLLGYNKLKYLFYFFSIVFSCLFLFGFYLNLKKLRKDKSTLELFLILVTLFYFGSLVLFKEFDTVTYRYFLCFYPVQFFIIAMGCLSFSLKLSRVLSVLCGSMFVLLLSFNFSILNSFKMSGRTHYVNSDNLEINLNKKIDFLKSIKTISTYPTQDPFEIFHGRAINKFRLEEFDLRQIDPYFALTRSATGQLVKIDKQLIEKKPEIAKLAVLPNLEDIKSFKNPDLKIIDLEIENLPQNLVLEYFDAANTSLGKINWTNVNYILPFKFFENLKSVKKIKFSFSILKSKNKYLNVLLNSKPSGFRSITSFEGDKLKIENAAVNPDKVYLGNLLAQDQYIYNLDKILTSSVAVEFELEINPFMPSNYYRVDIFGTDFLPPQEELVF